MHRQAGVTLVELLAAMSIMGIALGTFALYLTPMEGGLNGGVTATEGFVRQARATAMATTSAWRVSPDSKNTLAVERASSCSSGSWTLDPDLHVELPKDVEFSDTGWEVCFGSRGTADDNIIIELKMAGRGKKQIEVLRGGTTRIIK